MGKFISSLTEDIISELAQYETGKRQYYRPVYSLHKWWARRPGVLFRSILLATQKNNNDLFITNDNGSISARSEYFQNHNFGNVIVFDPFMGGGTTLVEANRLGAKVIGCDLNPVSYWIVKETLKPIDLNRLINYFKILELTAGEKIKKLYETDCAICGTKSNSLYSFWVKSIECPKCGKEVMLYKRTLLNEGKSRNKPPSNENLATVFCPSCLKLNLWKGSGLVTCESCEHIFNPEIGTYDHGIFKCTHCGEPQIRLIDVMRTGKQFKEKLVAIEYWCSHCNDRLYKTPDQNDKDQLNHINQHFSDNKEEFVVPRQKILPGASSARWRAHNIKYYYQVFNSRQLLAFNYLITEISKIPDENYRDAIFTIFSNSLEYNNMMTPYNYKHRKLHHLFNYHALPLTTTPVENSVWGYGDEGAGTFANCFKRYVKAKEYCLSPFDKYKDNDNNVKTIYSKSEIIEAKLIFTFNELKQTDRGALLLCSDSSDLPSIPNETVDYVITDPPYFDSIHYSELSNFFYIWLSSILKDPHFVLENVPTAEEAIVNNGMDKGENEYQQLLMSVFTECNRTLKKKGLLIFTFHHTKWRAWWTVLNAIIGSGFRVIDTFPVLSEYKVNPHIRNKQSLDMDLVLICQKRSIPFDPLSKTPMDILERAASSLPDDALNSTNNKLFLYFMGELLITASSNGHGDLTYEWFENILRHFDDFLTKVRQSVPTVVYRTHSYEQLRLMERRPKNVGK